MSSYSSYSSGIGERMLSIGEFKGIDQSRGSHSPDYGTSPDAVNFISRYGKLYTASGVALHGVPAGSGEDCQGRLFQAFFRDSDGNDVTHLLMFVDGCIYASEDATASTWKLIGSGFHSDNWDAVNYRDGSDDWVILTNGVDNVQYWDGWSDSVSMLLNIEPEEEILEEDVPKEEISDEPVLAEDPPAEDIFEPDTIMGVGDSLVLNAVNFPWDYDLDGSITVMAVSGDTSLLTVSYGTVNDPEGEIMVNAQAPGDVVLTVTADQRSSEDDGFMSKHEAAYKIRIIRFIEAINLDYPDCILSGESFVTKHNYADIQVGSSLQISPRVVPEDYTESLVWKSENESVATVDQNGLVTALKSGECVILCYPESWVDDLNRQPAAFYLDVHQPSVVADGDAVVEIRDWQWNGKNLSIAKNASDSSDYYLSGPSTDYEIGVGREFASSVYERKVAIASFADAFDGLPFGNAIEQIRMRVWADTSSPVAYAPYSYSGDVGMRRVLMNLISAKSNKFSSGNTADGKKIYFEYDITSAYKTGIYDSIVFFDTTEFASVATHGFFDLEVTLEIKYRYHSSGAIVEPEEVPEVVVPEEPKAIQQGGDTLVFSQIALLRERLWGAVSPAYPDRIYWSNTFDPNDWELNWEDSANVGGGFIDISTFDGTRIRAILSAFDEVLVFKDKSIHRITGSSPGEFAVASVYSSEGTLAPRTIVYTGDKVYFLSVDGLCVYNGVTAAPMSAIGDRKLRDVWRRINESTITTACAVLKDNIIYLAIPLDGSIINTHVIEYNLFDGTYSIVELPGVDDWLLMREGQKETLLYLNANGVYQYGVGYTFAGAAINASWISPEISGASLSSRKTTGRVYMKVDAQPLDINKDPYIKISMISGDKTREKLIRLKSGVNDIRKRVKIRGRTFRFKIENVNGDPLTIHRGIEIVIEEDYD